MLQETAGEDIPICQVSICRDGAESACACMQAGELGECTIPLTFPEGWLLDDDGNSIRETSIAPSDIAAVLLGLGVATVDLTCNHSSFTLNNLIACLIATDILQAGTLWPPCMLLHACG